MTTSTRRAGRRVHRAPPPGPGLFGPAAAGMPPGPDLTQFDLIAASISGGKDSQTMLRSLVAACVAAGVPLARVVCIFADLGKDDEWPGTGELAAAHAAHYGLRFITVRRMVKDPVTGERRPQGLLEHIERRGMWPDAENRYCTSDLKRGPVLTAITRLVREIRDAWRARAPGSVSQPRRVRVLNVMGMRAQESPRRRKMLPYCQDGAASNKTRRTVHTWLPIHDWPVERVWSDIKLSGVRYHQVYDLGLPRLSCRFCVLASKGALVRSAQIDPAGAQRRIGAERRFAVTRIVVTFAAAIAVQSGEWPGRETAWLLWLLRRVCRSGHKFQANLSMTEIAALAAAAPEPVAAPDWTA